MAELEKEVERQGLLRNGEHAGRVRAEKVRRWVHLWLVRVCFVFEAFRYFVIQDGNRVQLSIFALSAISVLIRNNYR